MPPVSALSEYLESEEPLQSPEFGSMDSAVRQSDPTGFTWHGILPAITVEAGDSPRIPRPSPQLPRSASLTIHLKGRGPQTQASVPRLIRQINFLKAF